LSGQAAVRNIMRFCHLFFSICMLCKFGKCLAGAPVTRFAGSGCQTISKGTLCKTAPPAVQMSSWRGYGRREEGLCWGRVLKTELHASAGSRIKIPLLLLTYLLCACRTRRISPSTELFPAAIPHERPLHLSGHASTPSHPMPEAHNQGVGGRIMKVMRNTGFFATSQVGARRDEPLAAKARERH